MKLNFVEIRKFLDYTGKIISKRSERVIDFKNINEENLTEKFVQADLSGITAFPDPNCDSHDFRFVSGSVMPTSQDEMFTLYLDHDNLPDEAYFEGQNGWTQSYISNGYVVYEPIWINGSMKNNGTDLD